MNLADAHAAELAEIRAGLAHLSEVVVTDDSVEGVSALSSNALVVIIPAPAVEFTTRGMWEMTWEVWALAPTIDPGQTTRQLSPVLEAFANLGAEQARPDTFETSGSVFSGYIITTTSTYS